VWGGPGHGAVGLVHIHKELVCAVNAHCDDHPCPPEAAAVGCRRVDVVRGDGVKVAGVGRPVVGEVFQRVRVLLGMLGPLGVVVVDAVCLRVILVLERVEESADPMLCPQVGEQPAVTREATREKECNEKKDEDYGCNQDVAGAGFAAGVVGWGVEQRHRVRSSGQFLRNA